MLLMEKGRLKNEMRKKCRIDKVEECKKAFLSTFFSGYLRTLFMTSCSTMVGHWTADREIKCFIPAGTGKNGGN
jgi:hypothetical protein